MKSTLGLVGHCRSGGEDLEGNERDQTPWNMLESFIAFLCFCWSLRLSGPLAATPSPATHTKHPYCLGLPSSAAPSLCGATFGWSTSFFPATARARARCAGIAEQNPWTASGCFHEAEDQSSRLTPRPPHVPLAAPARFAEGTFQVPCER